MLQLGARVDLHNAHTSCTVTRSLGEGAQGHVYAVSVDSLAGAPEYALKWYKPGFDTARQRALLDALIERGIPSNRFLWPIDLADSESDEGFGYLMPLRPATYTPLHDVLNGRAEASSQVIITIGMELAQSLLTLHSSGLCYRDINLGNVFFDLETGAVVICDVDNVGIDGASTSEIGGSPFFTAPEVLRGEALPGTATDLYSLSVLLFLLLVAHLPLLGRRAADFETLDAAAELELFGTAPIFIFDPDDASNRPVPGEDDNAIRFWPVLPPYLRKLFITAFTDGLTNPSARVAEGVWRKALARLRDALVTCPRCQTDAFFDEELGGAVCGNCGADIPLPPVLAFNSSDPVFLREGTFVTRHHIRRDYDFTTKVAEAVGHPADPTLIGLRNLTDTTWTVRLPSGPETVIEPERAIGIVDGMQIEFEPGRVGHLALPDPGTREGS
jgi:DNA-binding helix-hairpin-helix protein with protein kinase domain